MTDSERPKRKRGGQPGNMNAAGLKPLTDALRRAVLAQDGKRLRTLAERLTKMAETSVPAWRELADRVEGKVIQQVEMSGPDGGAIKINDPEAKFNRARKLAFILAQGAIVKAQKSAQGEPDASQQKG